MKIALLQMVSGQHLDHNLTRAQALLTQAAQAGAELAVLPEYFCLLGARDTDKLGLQEPQGQGPIQQWLTGMARELGLWIVGGTLPLQGQTPNRVRNSSLVINPDGLCVARYDKIHLFCYDNGRERYDEARVLEPGRQPVVFDLPSRDGHAWRVGLSICYDLRFPELYRTLVREGAQLLLVPSAFTHTTGQAHWEVLLRARAIENLCWVAAAAQGGTHDNGRQTWGHSLVADPWGRVCAQAELGEQLVMAELSMADLQAWRAQLPALGHRVL